MIYTIYIVHLAVNSIKIEQQMKQPKKRGRPDNDRPPKENKPRGFQELLSNGRFLRNAEDLELKGHQQNLRKDEGNKSPKLSKWKEDQEAGRVSKMRE